MPIHPNILGAVGQTPLIRLNRVTDGSGSTFYAKAEFLNPGGSVKDRIGLAMIEEAEGAGLLKPGGTIIEATAGNTGVGLALAAATKGYRTIFVLPDKMSGDKIALLKAYGASIVITPSSVPSDSPETYNAVADRLAKEIPGAWRPAQFENPHNPHAHYSTTGPEIWRDTGGKVDVFVASMGTGGTISGTAKYLKERNPRLIVVGADPEGSILSGDTPRPYKVEGIGEDFIPRTFDRQIVDEMVRVGDRESFQMARRLAREEGLLVGGSSGTAMVAALKYAQRLVEPKDFVVLLPDTGRNYLSRIYSESWMKENGFSDGEERPNARLGEVLGAKRDSPQLLFVGPRDSLRKAIHLLQRHAISQIPVLEGSRVVGSLHEASLAHLFFEGEASLDREVSAVMAKPLPSLEDDGYVEEAHRLLLTGAGGIVVTHNGIPIGVVTRMDLVNHWANRKGDSHE